MSNDNTGADSSFVETKDTAVAVKGLKHKGSSTKNNDNFGNDWPFSEIELAPKEISLRAFD